MRSDTSSIVNVALHLVFQCLILAFHRERRLRDRRLTRVTKPLPTLTRPHGPPRSEDTCAVIVYIYIPRQPLGVRHELSDRLRLA